MNAHVPDVARALYALAGPFEIPPVKYVAREDIGGANGQYRGHVIILAHDAGEITLAHEIGHHLDHSGLLPDWVKDVALNLATLIVDVDGHVVGRWPHPVTEVEYRCGAPITAELYNVNLAVKFSDEYTDYFTAIGERVARTVALIYKALTGDLTAALLLERAGAPTYFLELILGDLF